MKTWPNTHHSMIERLANPDDATAWKYFEDCYQSAIYRMARARGLRPDEAHDVVQEVLIAVHRLALRWTSSGHPGSFRAWLVETTRRQAFASLRFRARVGQSLHGVEDPIQAPDHPDPRDQQEWLFYQAIAEVEKETNPLHWQAFWKTSIDGLDAKSVADALQLKLGTVYSIKSRVLHQIKQRIEQLTRNEVQGERS